jgi:hypothetical protein
MQRACHDAHTLRFLSRETPAFGAGVAARFVVVARLVEAWALEHVAQRRFHFGWLLRRCFVGCRFRFGDSRHRLGGGCGFEIGFRGEGGCEARRQQRSGLGTGRAWQCIRGARRTLAAC